LPLAFSRACAALEGPLDAQEGSQDLNGLCPAFVRIGPPSQLVQVRAHTGKLANVLLLQGCLAKAVVQGALADEIRHSLALGLRLGRDRFLLSRGDAKLDPGCPARSLFFHGVTCLDAFGRGRGGRSPPASPGRGHRVSACPQRVGWLCDMPPMHAGCPQQHADGEKSEISEIRFMRDSPFLRLFRFFRLIRAEPG